MSQQQARVPLRIAPATRRPARRPAWNADDAWAWPPRPMRPVRACIRIPASPLRAELLDWARRAGYPPLQVRPWCENMPGIDAWEAFCAHASLPELEQTAEVVRFAHVLLMEEAG